MRKRHARTPGRDKNFVGVTQKIFSVLEALSQQPKSGLPLDEITEITGMAKTTVHRLLCSMGKLGYIEQDPVTNLYSLSGKFFELGTNALPYQRLTVLAKPLMQSLLLTFGESVNLAVPMSGLAIYILVLESPRPHRVAAAVGNYSYFHCTSVGKSIAAYLSPEELEQSLIRYGLPAMTPSSITTRSRLEEELAKVRAEGVAVDNEENAQGDHLRRRADFCERRQTHRCPQHLRPQRSALSELALRQDGRPRDGPEDIALARTHTCSESETGR